MIDGLKPSPAMKDSIGWRVGVRCLTQRQMSELFETTPENVVMHLKNVFTDGELDEAATAKDFLVVQTEGKRKVRRNIKHYNLDAIISVGYQPPRISR